jgi:hypothetical protein
MINSFVTRSRETEDPRNVWQAARVSKVVSHDGGAHAGPASHAVRESASAFDTRHKALTRCCQRGGAQHRGAGEHVGLCCTACQLIEHDAHYSGPMQGRRREIMALLMRELPDTAAATLLLDRLEPGDDEVLLCPSAGFSASQCPPRLCQSRWAASTGTDLDGETHAGSLWGVGRRPARAVRWWCLMCRVP